MPIIHSKHILLCRILFLYFFGISELSPNALRLSYAKMNWNILKYVWNEFKYVNLDIFRYFRVFLDFSTRLLIIYQQYCMEQDNKVEATWRQYLIVWKIVSFQGRNVQRKYRLLLIHMEMQDVKIWNSGSNPRFFNLRPFVAAS